MSSPISNISQPQIVTPAYNDVFFVCDSSNKAEDGFLYIAQVYVNGDLKRTSKVPPLGTNSYGKIELSKFLSSYLSKTDLLNGANEKPTVNECYVAVQVKWGQEYYSDIWDFDGYTTADATLWSNFADPNYNPNGLAKTCIYNTTGQPVPPYAIGDYILLNQTTINRDELEGVFRVLDIEDISAGGYEYIVVLDLAWIGSGTATDGVTNYADKRKIQQLAQIDTSTILTFNGALPFEDFKNWDYTDYVADGVTKKFLTNAPRSGYVVRPDSKVFLNTLLVFATGNKIVLDDGTPAAYTITETDYIIQLNCSPSETTIGDENYTAQVQTSANAALTEEFSFIVDNTCYGYDDAEIIFLDRLGSILPFQFTYKIDTDINIERETSKRDISTNTMYDYSLTDAGTVHDNITEERTLTLRTTRLSSDMAVYFRELVSSGWTSLRIGSSGDYIRCNIVTNSYKLKDSYTDGLKTYEIQVKYANKDIINW
jgi:hypothetical protein